LLRTLEAGCSAPVAAFAQLEDHEGAGGEGREGAGGEERGAVLHLRALAIRTDGSRVVEGQARVALDLTQDRLSGPGSLPAELGAERAADRRSRGAGRILAEARAGCPRGPRAAPCGAPGRPRAAPRASPRPPTPRPRRG